MSLFFILSSLASSPGWEHFIVFLSNLLDSYSLFPRRWINSYWQIQFCEVHVALTWTKHPIGGGKTVGEEGSRNTSSWYMLQEIGISVHLMGHLPDMQTSTSHFPLPTFMLPRPLIRTNATHFTWKWLDFQENERTGYMHFYTNRFAQRLVFSETKVNYSSMHWLREFLIFTQYPHYLCYFSQQLNAVYWWL